MTGIALILTESEDMTADMIMDALRKMRVEILRVDPGDFPQRLEMCVSSGHTWTGYLRSGGEIVPIESVTSIYYRRPSDFVFPNGMTRPEERFARAEATFGLGGLLLSLSATWVNHPARIADANYKPLQVDVASKIGLRVPRTLLTNVPAEAEKFLTDTDGPVIYKPLSSLAAPEGSGVRLIYTSIVRPGDFETGQVSATAHIFQEFVPKEFDVRVTVVGRTCFATEIHTASPTGKVDWRSDYDSLRYSPTTIPPAVEEGIIAYTTRMGLNFAAFDFAVTPGGDWFFLEANPNGQWAWISNETGAPIAEAIANLLACRAEG
jgi:ATP-grasp ribosomal peptide maturase